MSTNEQDAVRATDVAPVSKSPPPKTTTVKIDRVTVPRHAHITSKDRTIDMMVPVDMVARRFMHDERVAYFKAHSVGSSLEIDDRVEMPEEKRW